MKYDSDLSLRVKDKVKDKFYGLRPRFRDTFKV
jgi:hypothetical protein